MECGENKFNVQSGSDNAVSCELCPQSSSTDGMTSASRADQCICDAGYYANALLADGPDCKACGVGVKCHMPGTTRWSLVIQKGYWRPSEDSLDVRRCPDVS